MLPVTPVPGTDVRYTGVSGRPLPAVSWLVIVQPRKNFADRAVQRPAAADADAAGVLHLRGQQVTLIEVRRRPLGVEIAPVLRDRRSARCSRR